MPNFFSDFLVVAQIESSIMLFFGLFVVVGVNPLFTAKKKRIQLS
jgi:hypothetical protein